MLTHLGRPRFRRMPKSGAGDDAPLVPARHATTRVWLSPNWLASAPAGVTGGGGCACLAPWGVLVGMDP